MHTGLVWRDCESGRGDDGVCVEAATYTSVLYYDDKQRLSCCIT
jgi:hypothetical protein